MCESAMLRVRNRLQTLVMYVSHAWKDRRPPLKETLRYFNVDDLLHNLLVQLYKEFENTQLILILIHVRSETTYHKVVVSPKLIFWWYSSFDVFLISTFWWYGKFDDFSSVYRKQYIKTWIISITFFLPWFEEEFVFQQ